MAHRGWSISLGCFRELPTGTLVKLRKQLAGVPVTLTGGRVPPGLQQEAAQWPLGHRSKKKSARTAGKSPFLSQWPSSALYWQTLSWLLAKEKWLHGPAPVSKHDLNTMLGTMRRWTNAVLTLKKLLTAVKKVPTWKHQVFTALSL